jgi:hypothetical protein
MTRVRSDARESLFSEGLENAYTLVRSCRNCGFQQFGRLKCLARSIDQLIKTAFQRIYVWQASEPLTTTVDSIIQPKAQPLHILRRSRAISCWTTSLSVGLLQGSMRRALPRCAGLLDRCLFETKSLGLVYHQDRP